MVGRFRSDDAARITLAEHRLVTGRTPGHAITHERSGRRTGRRNTHPDTDDGGAQDGEPVARHLDQRTADLRHFHAGLDALEAQAFFRRQEQFADTEQAHDGNQERDALDQFRNIESQAQIAGDRIHADRRQREAEHHRNQGLEWRLRTQSR